MYTVMKHIFPKERKKKTTHIKLVLKKKKERVWKCFSFSCLKQLESNFKALRFREGGGKKSLTDFWRNPTSKLNSRQISQQFAVMSTLLLLTLCFISVLVIMAYFWGKKIPKKSHSTVALAIAMFIQ